MPINLGMAADTAVPAPERARQDDANAGAVFPTHLQPELHSESSSHKTHTKHEQKEQENSLFTVININYFINM